MSSQSYRLEIQVDPTNAESNISRLKNALGQLEQKGNQSAKGLDGLKKHSTDAAVGLGKLGDEALLVNGRFYDVNGRLREANGRFVKLGDSTNKTKTAMQGMERTSQGVSRALGVMTSLLAGVAGAIGIGAIIRTADSMQTLSSQIKNVTASTQDYSRAMSEIERIAMGNRVALESVGELYVSNERSLKQLGKSQAEVVAFTENITTAMRLGGGSAAGQAAALTQLGQAMASGALRGDEFNSIAEQAPMIMQLLADSLGVTTGKLREMAAQGKLTADVVYNAMTSAEATSKLDEMSSKTATTVAGAFENIRTQYKLAVAEFMNGENGISQAIAGILLNIAELIPKVTEFLTAVKESEQAQIAINALGEAMGALKSVASGMIGAVSAFGDWLREHPKTAQFLTGALTALVAIFVGFKTAAILATIAVGAFGVAMGIVASPILLITGLIAALAGAGYVLYKNWDTIKAKAQEIWFAIGEIVAIAVDNVKGHWQNLKNSLKRTTDDIKAGVTTAFTNIKNTAISAFGALPASVRVPLALMGNAFSTAFATIKALVSGDIQGAVIAIRQGMTNAVRIVAQSVKELLTPITELGAKFLQAGRDAVQGLINGIRAKFSEAVSTVRNLATELAGSVKSALQIRSPSRVMAQLGEWTALGLAKGIADKTPAVGKAARNMAEQIKQNVASKLAELKRELALFGNDNMLSELSYDIGLGMYGNNTKQLTELATKLYSQQQTQAVLDDISQITQSMVLHGKTAREVLEWQIANTKQYHGVLEQTLDEYKAILDAQDEHNRLIERQTAIQQANQQVLQSTADIYKQIALYGNQSRLAEFDYDHTAGKYGDADVQKLQDYRRALEQLEHLERKNSTKGAFDKLSTEFVDESPLQKLQNTLDERLRIISEYEQAHTDVAEQAGMARAQAQAQFDRSRMDLMIATYENGLGAVGSILKSAFGEQSKAYRVMFAVEKGMALARIMLANKEALAKAWASAPFPYNLPAVAKTLVETGALASAVNAINPIIGQAHDGIMSVPKSGTWNLEKGERVLPHKTAKALDSTLDNLQGSGVVINQTITINADGSSSVNQDNPSAIGKTLENGMVALIQREMRQGGAIHKFVRG